MCFRWSCDDSVTHYIYQGKVGDNTKEYRAVKERGLHIVSQHWLHAVCYTYRLLYIVFSSWCMKFPIALFVQRHSLSYHYLTGFHYPVTPPVMCTYISLQCAEEQKRVPESLYPFTFNPKMSLMLSQVTDSTQKSPPLSTPLSKLRALDDDDTRVWVFLDF